VGGIIRLLTEQSDKVLKGSGLADQADAAVSVKPAGAQKTALLYTRFAKRRANQISG
jgi:hypothetical protein